MEYNYRWRVRSRLAQYYGHKCAVTARGAMNSCRVEFPDGKKFITSRNYVIREDTWQKRRARKSTGAA